MNMATYETFAAVYDAVMDDSLYDLWTDFSLRHLPKSKDRKKLLELACGTGIQSVRFSQAGFDVTGLDLSADMLKIAEKRAASACPHSGLILSHQNQLGKSGQTGSLSHKPIPVIFSYLLSLGDGGGKNPSTNHTDYHP